MPENIRRGAARRLRTRFCALTLLSLLTACAVIAPRSAWEDRLAGNNIVLLGEVHDNAEQHAQRLRVLQRALAAGWRPAIAMEQFDRERQPDIDRARREQPRNAQYLIDLAGNTSADGTRGWNWAYYRPFVELALAYDLPLIAANVSAMDTAKIVRGGFTAVFNDAEIKALQLDRTIPPPLQAAHEREIDAGHCHALPAALWPGMARAQFARDAAMAKILREHPGRGIVLLAGNGHVRADLGVPQWLTGAERARLFTVGYLEIGDTRALDGAFDVIVRTADAPRADPCQAFAASPARRQ
jgi:uncharacterized iron-regulated protein